MAVTYTFSANTKIKSSEVNQNFTDCVSPYTAHTLFASGATGFSSLPTDLSYYTVMGKFCMVNLLIAGTSNAAGVNFTINLPVGTAVKQFDAVVRITDNGSALTTPGLVESGAGATTAGVYKDMAATGTFTAANTKGVQGQFMYQWTS